MIGKAPMSQRRLDFLKKHGFNNEVEWGHFIAPLMFFELIDFFDLAKELEFEMISVQSEVLMFLPEDFR